MAKRSKKGNGGVKTADYRHAREKRTNIPPAKIAAEGNVPKAAVVRYRYSPHLPPALRFDPTGKADKIPELIAKAGSRPLSESEQKLLAEALRNQQPWLEWAGKQEEEDRGFFKIDPVALQIHERVSAQAIVRSAMREDIQRDLFGEQDLPYQQQVQFYRHNIGWTNRIILGDSLQVMTSLARREQLAGQVQTIYIDPPYGIDFSSNFQPELGSRNVNDKDSDLTREPEMVRAYRDTWTLGLHSYLAYLRQRLIVAHELLHQSGSIFVQINERNVHVVRALLDEVFGVGNAVCLIYFRKKTMPLGGSFLERMGDYLLWYAKDIAQVKFRRLSVDQNVTDDFHWSDVELPDGSRLDKSLVSPSAAEQGNPIRLVSLWPPSFSPSAVYPFEAFGKTWTPPAGQCWPTGPVNMLRMLRAGRLEPEGKYLRYVMKLSDSGRKKLTPIWNDTIGARNQRYVVQTSEMVVERCIWMTTDPGDLVLDPTCGGGTTAYVCEKWGRRWITTDTSRVAISLARERLLTSRFDAYRLKSTTATEALDPGVGFVYRRSPRIDAKAISNNANLDPLFDRHEKLLAVLLTDLNRALGNVRDELRRKLTSKLTEKQRVQGKKSITEADRRRWNLPKTEWQEWEVPFDADPDWPGALQDALTAYRAAWKLKVDEVNACIAANAGVDELVDKPEVVSGVVRVSGPFTVEGVRPEELSIGEDGLFDPTPNDAESGDASDFTDTQNPEAYLSQMVQHLRSDGVTFLNNQKKTFSRLDALFEDASGSLIHAEGSWEDSEDRQPNTIAISVGPQSGPVTALQVEEAIRAAKRYDDLVIAGFSFDAEAFAVVEEQSHPKLRVHLAQIRPDLNRAMDGLLKNSPDSQLFTVFGQPDINVHDSKDGWVCTLAGVSIYDPLENMVRSTGAEKVAAWFLDSDFDGRCFCITQAFFPDQNAWAKIAKSLGSGADPEAFEKFKGTTSLPFTKGKYGRIAVKVIDPRGNEVMAIRKLE